MALKITDLTGTTTAPGGANPYGDVDDNPGGTLVDKKMVHDMLIFFQQLMGSAAITPNSLPDNSTNGFQLYAALIANPVFGSPVIGAFSANFTTLNAFQTAATADIIDIYSKIDLAAWTNITLGTGWTATPNPPQYRNDGTGRIYLRGAATAGAGASAIFGTLPTGNRPAQEMDFAVYAIISSTSGLSFMDISALGVMSPGNNATGTVIRIDGIIFLNS